ncbi:MAG: hypothetical protein PHX34_01905 [Candidatus Shapirobacteria bacterium]|nr:hypothetical protein [Candidatus Shapirobacteria bacterium]
MREYEYFLIEKERKKASFSLVVEHDIDNLVFLIKDPRVDEVEKQKLIDDKLIPNLINSRNSDLLRKELLKYIEDKDLIKREVAFIGLEAINKADFERRENISVEKRGVLGKLENILGMIVRGRS